MSTVIAPSAKAARLVPAKGFVKICHYGSGRFASSPVILTLPREVCANETSFLTTLDFAEAFAEVFYSATSAGELSALRRAMSDITYYWSRGQVGRARAYMSDTLALWERESLCSVLSYPHGKTADEKLLDSLGQLAAASMIELKPKDTWLDWPMFITPKMMGYSTLVTISSLMTGFAGMEITGDTGAVLLGIFGLFFLRFHAPGSKLFEPSFAHMVAGELVTTYDEAHERLTKALIAGASPAEVYAIVEKELAAVYFGGESKKLGAEISQALAVEASLVEEEIASKPAPFVPSAMLEAFTESSFAGEEKETLEAQKALLSELKARADLRSSSR